MNKASGLILAKHGLLKPFAGLVAKFVGTGWQKDF
jgi:hypothetical protein